MSGETKGPKFRISEPMDEREKELIAWLRARQANSREPAEAAPPELAPEQVEVAVRVVPDETGHVAVAVRMLPDGAELDQGELPLEFGILRSEGEKLLEGEGPEALLLHVAEDWVGRHVFAVVEEGDFEIRRAFGALLREVLGVHVGVLPVVVAGLDEKLHGVRVVDVEENQIRRGGITQREVGAEEGHKPLGLVDEPLDHAPLGVLEDSWQSANDLTRQFPLLPFVCLLPLLFFGRGHTHGAYPFIPACPIPLGAA